MTTFSMLKIINEFFRILWLSVSSVDFYRDLYARYKGYGIKYITMVISITSIIYAILFMYNINVIRNYLEQSVNYDSSNTEVNPIEFMLKDWPVLEYDGKTITCEDPTPVYITSLSGIKIAAIDAAGNLTKDQMQNVPLVFTKDKIILWTSSEAKDSKKEINSWTFSYSNIWGKEPKIIDYEFIKSFILDEIKQIGPVIFCIALPIIILLRLVMHILLNIRITILLYVIFWWLKIKPTPASVSRIVFFSSGVAEFITPFVLLMYQPLMPITLFIQFWALVLAIYAIVTTQMSSTRKRS